MSDCATFQFEPLFKGYFDKCLRMKKHVHNEDTKFSLAAVVSGLKNAKKSQMSAVKMAACDSLELTAGTAD